MHSIDYYWSNTPGIRKLLLWKNQKKIQAFKKWEDSRKIENPLNLRNFEEKVYSQNGEDGIIQEIFKRIGPTDKYFVEFGVENGTECNGRNLIENHGWSGLWMDGGEENVRSAKNQFSQFPIEIQKQFITQENIVNLFEGAQVPQEFDLLSIDIDGNDYWIWKKLKGYRPRVVVVEYNASHTPGNSWVMPYQADHLYDGTSYYGASLDAWCELAKELGYILVSCDSSGVNAFFVRNDLVAGHFPDSNEEISYHYCAPKYRKLFFGHPKGKGPWGG